jgi:putative ABC transport system ATP-binding protein
MPSRPVPDLLVEGLELRAGDRVLLSVPSLAVPAGQAVAVRGPSGAGKSSLLHVLAGLARPQEGRVLWGGTDIAALSEEGRARVRRTTLGLVFQDFLLFEELGAEGNAALAAAFAPRPERPALREGARGWLGRLGLSNHGTRRVDSFSGGERQRVAVARALANGAPVILADEPTASLDRANADRLAADLLALAGERTLICVTHDTALAGRVGRVLTLENGRIVEDAGG